MAGRYSIRCICRVAFLGSFLFCSQPLLASEVNFDAPAMLTARPLSHDDIVLRGEKLVEVIIPVSSQIRPDIRAAMSEFRFDVFWNRSAYPVIDYGPRTRTTTGVDGTISVERRSDRQRTLGISLNSGYEDIVTGTAQAQLSRKNGTTYRYQEIPQHDVLVASGTVRRGTGVFFRFHPSKQETLEGGRDLIVAFRVPQTWRGGILQVECRAAGEKKLLGPWGEPIQVGRAFVMPVYLEGDDQARETATRFAQSQIDLTQTWNRRIQRKKPTGFKQEIESLFGVGYTDGVPAAWPQHLIQSGDDRHYDRHHRELPETIRTAARAFIRARQEILSMAR